MRHMVSPPLAGTLGAVDTIVQSPGAVNRAPWGGPLEPRPATVYRERHHSPWRCCAHGTRSPGPGLPRAGREVGAPGVPHAVPEGRAAALPRDASGLDAGAAGDRQRAGPDGRRAARPDPAARLPAGGRLGLDSAAGARLLPRRGVGDRRPRGPRRAGPAPPGPGRPPPPARPPPA